MQVPFQLSVQQPLYSQDMQTGPYGVVRQMAEYNLKGINAAFGPADELGAQKLRASVFTKREGVQPSSEESHYKKKLANAINIIAGGDAALNGNVKNIIKDVYASSFELGFKSGNNPSYVTLERQDAYEDRMNMLRNDLCKFSVNADMIHDVAQAGLQSGAAFAEQYGL
ncbi:MAG TPA: hypothetical protein VGF14_04350 [Alphaproteobacteria bacterium]